jgi:hypothetical protein
MKREKKKEKATIHGQTVFLICEKKGSRMIRQIRTFPTNEKKTLKKSYQLKENIVCRHVVEIKKIVNERFFINMKR